MQVLQGLSTRGTAVCKLHLLHSSLVSLLLLLIRCRAVGLDAHVLVLLLTASKQRSFVLAEGIFSHTLSFLYERLCMISDGAFGQCGCGWAAAANYHRSKRNFIA